MSQDDGNKRDSNSKRRPRPFIEKFGQKEKDKIGLMGRRRFLNFLSGLGLSSLSIQRLSQETVAKKTDDPKSEIPIPAGTRVKHPHKHEEGLPNHPLEVEEKTVTVSKDRWKHTQAARDADKKIRKFVNNRFDEDQISVRTECKTSFEREVVVSVTTVVKEIVTNQEEIGPDTPPETKTVEVEPDVSPDTVATRLPNHVPGHTQIGPNGETMKIPVRVVSEKSKLCKSFNERYRPVPGGCRQHAYPDYDWDYTLGTNCYPFSSSDADERVMLTAGHNFDDPNNNKDYEHIHQPGKDYTGGNKVGDHYKHVFTNQSEPKKGNDAGVWKTDSGIDLTNKLAKDGGGTRTTVKGTVSWSMIDAYAGDSDYEVKLQGTTSGISSGKITGLIQDHKNFETNLGGEGGDSGGPTYHELNDGVELLGITKAANLTSDDTYHQSIEQAMGLLNLSL